MTYLLRRAPRAFALSARAIHEGRPLGDVARELRAVEKPETAALWIVARYLTG